MRDHRFDAVVARPDDAALVQRIGDIGRHRQRVGRDKVEAVAVEFRQRLRQGVHRAAIFQVADHGDAQVVQAALRLKDGKEIQQRLGRVLIGAIPGVKDRHAAGKFRGEPRRALLRMTHHDGVDVGADNGNRIRQGFALFAERGIAAVGETHHRRAQPVHRRFKRQARARRGLKEAAGDNLVLQQLRLRIGFQSRGGVQHQLQFVATQIVNRNNMFAI